MDFRSIGLQNEGCSIKFPPDAPAKRCSRSSSPWRVFSSRRQASCPSSIAALRTPRSACSSTTSPSNVFDLATADPSLVNCLHAGPQDPPPSRWPSQSPYCSMPWPCGSSPLKPPTTLRSNLLSEPAFSRRDLISSGTEHHDSRDARGELCECSRMFLLGEMSDHRHYFELFEVRRGPQTSVRDQLQQSPMEAPGSPPSAPSTRPNAFTDIRDPRTLCATALVCCLGRLHCYQTFLSLCKISFFFAAKDVANFVLSASTLSRALLSCANWS